MPRVETKYFGSQDYAEDAVICIPDGVPGFEDDCAFLLIQFRDQFPLVYLQSTTRPDVCFPALPVRVFDQQYKLELTEDDAEKLALSTRPVIGLDVLCLGMLVARATGTFVNLLAPVIVNITTRRGAQCINVAGNYSWELAAA